jgi:hypothetical protein
MKNNCIFALHNFEVILCILAEINTLRLREYDWFQNRICK